jgi:hypothetical protein
MRTLLLTLALIGGPALAEEPIYGNDSGCRGTPFDDDFAVRVSGTRIEGREGVCILPPDWDYSGTWTRIECSGESGEWTEPTSLKTDGDTLVYQGKVVLKRCE